MKKVIIFLGLFAGIFMGILILNYETLVSNSNEKIPSIPSANETPAEAVRHEDGGSKEELKDSNKKSQLGKVGKELASDAPINFEKLKSLRQLEMEYRNLDEVSLKSELMKSKKYLQSLLLVEKANQGKLTEGESQTLALELRKQTVLHKLIIDSLVGEDLGPT